MDSSRRLAGVRMIYGLGDNEAFGVGRISTDSRRPILDVQYRDSDAVDRRLHNAANKMLQGYLVNPDTVPRMVCWESQAQPILDYVIAVGSPIVSEAFRHVVEKRDPGVHQFLPVDIHRAKASAPFARHYWFVICRRLHSLHESALTPLRTECGRWRTAVGDRCVFNKAVIGDAPIWTDPDMRGSVFCSTLVAEALAEARLTGLRFHEYQDD